MSTATLTRPEPTCSPAPERSLAQRMEALARANGVRSKRAQLKRDLKAGRQEIRELLLNPPGYLETAKVFDLLLAVPKLGRVKVNQRLNVVKIAPSKRVGGLSTRQRHELIKTLRPGWSGPLSTTEIQAAIDRERQEQLLVDAVRRASARTMDGWAYASEIWGQLGPSAGAKASIGGRLARAQARGLVCSRRLTGDHARQWRPGSEASA